MKDYYITSHAKDRLRQRFGIESIDVAMKWIHDKLTAATLHRMDHHKEIYRVANIEIVMDGTRVVTVKPLYGETPIMQRIKNVVDKEVGRTLLAKEREFRKAEIQVAEITLNMLKARNPRIKESLKRKLTIANDYKANIETEIVGIKKAAEHYGVSV